jgi:MIP family channel proteins
VSETLRPVFAEAFGTFALVFTGTAAIVVDALYGGAITHVGVALTFGLIVLAMIYALGEISGAHLNPAVTLGFVIANRFPLRRIPAYLLAQTTGAFSASAVVMSLFPDHTTLGSTLPAGSVAQSWILEFLLTAILMTVILGVSSGSKELGVLAGIAVGAVIGLEAIFAGPVSGASMNPVRSLAPAVVSGNLQHLWVYLTSPFCGSFAGVGIWFLIRPMENPR